VETFTVTDHDVPANQLHYYRLVSLTVNGREIVHGPTVVVVYNRSEGHLMFLPLGSVDVS
jgi:hypothetical protein